MIPPASRAASPWTWLLVLLVPLLVYAPTVRYGFLWDDWNNLVFSDHLTTWRGVIGSFLHPAMWSADSDTGAVATYRPLALASMALTHVLVSGAPWAHHAVSVLLHLATTAMVFRTLRGLLPHGRTALFATLIWAVHPINAEAVAWINGRSEIFAAFGVAWAVDASRRGRSFEVALATAFALLGKETGIIAVPAALLVRALILSRPLGDSLRMLGASLAGFSVWLAARTAAVGGSSGSDTGTLLSEGLPWVPSIIALALEAMLVPLRTGVVVVRDAVLLTDPALQLVHIALTTLLLLGLAAAVARGVRRTSTALLLLWLASLAPPVALVATGWAGFSRWLYVMGWAFVAACFAAANDPAEPSAPPPHAPPPPTEPGGAEPSDAESGGAEPGSGASPRARATSSRTGTLVGALVVGGMALLSLRANAAYRNDAALAQASVEDYPDQVFGYEMLAAEWMRVGRYDDALQLIDHASAWEDQRSRMQFPGSMRAFCLAQLDRCEEAASALATEFELWQPRRHGLTFVMIRHCWAERGDRERTELLDRALRDAVREGRVLPDQVPFLDGLPARGE